MSCPVSRANAAWISGERLCATGLPMTAYLSAMALGGKAFALVTGSVSSVRAAVEAGAQAIARKGLLVNRVVIPQPRPELLAELI